MIERLIVFIGLGLLTSTPSQVHAQAKGAVDLWLTSSDRSSLLAEQPQHPAFQKKTTQLPVIEVNDKIRFQKMEGFGFTLTGGSAELLMHMTPESRSALIKELFLPDGASVGVSYLRISIGSSDMNARIFTYDDLPPGQRDANLTHFSLGPDLADVIPVLKEILAINPRITILGSPWSAPS